MSCLTITLTEFTTVNSVLTNLFIQNVLLLLKYRHSDACTAPLVNGIVNNAVFHSIPHISQMLP